MNEASHEQDDLRALVRDVGRDTERHAPAFDTLWRAAQQANQAKDAARRRGPASHVWMVSAGLAVAACLAIMVYHDLSTRSMVKPVEQKRDANVEWTVSLEPEAPTDFLLAGNGAPESGRVEKLSREINDLLQP